MGVSDRFRAAVAWKAGFRGQALTIAVAVSKAENQSGDPGVISSTKDVGLWQINQVHWPRWGGADKLKEPLTNAQAAFSISAQGTNWGPWVTFKQGKHNAHLSAAAKATQGMSDAEADKVIAEGGGGGGGGGLLGNIADALNPADEIVGAIKGLLPKGWLKRLGKMVLGGGMVVLGGNFALNSTLLGKVMPRPAARAVRKGKRQITSTARGAVRQAARSTGAPPAGTPPGAGAGGVQGKATGAVVRDVMRTVQASARQGG